MKIDEKLVDKLNFIGFARKLKRSPDIVKLNDQLACRFKGLLPKHIFTESKRFFTDRSKIFEQQPGKGRHRALERRSHPQKGPPAC